MTFPSVGRFCCSIALGSTLIAAEGRSQAVGDSTLDTQWRTVQALSPGEFVEVRLLKNSTVSGTIVSSTDSALTLTREGGRLLNVTRSDIRELKVKRKQRTRNRAFGAAIGGASGIAVTAILDGALTDGNGTSGKYAALLGAVGAGIGFLTMLGPTYTTIYKIR
jgi:hypothetical protein